MMGSGDSMLITNMHPLPCTHHAPSSSLVDTDAPPALPLLLAQDELLDEQLGA